MGITKLIRAIGNKKTAPAKTGAAVKGGGKCAVLDHPQEGEKITSPHYTFRVGAAGDLERVEISINQGPWHPCRYAIGYWWHDWAGYTSGRYQAAVRAWAKGGKAVVCGPYKFQVALAVGGKRTK